MHCGATYTFSTDFQQWAAFDDPEGMFLTATVVATRIARFVIGAIRILDGCLSRYSDQG